MARFRPQSKEKYVGNAKAAERIARYLNKVTGLEASVERSKLSASTYVYVDDMEDLKAKSYKIRIAQHDLPEQYAWDTPNLTIDADGWRSAVEKAARFFGREVPKMKNPIPQNGTRIGDAQELYQKFHGKPSTQTVEVEHKVIVREHLSQLGILNEMTLHLVTGDKVVLSFVNEGPESIILAASPDGKQLYLEGGDQSLDLGKLKLSGAQWVRDIMVIGILKKLQYRTRKGFDDFELIDYYHRLGEETKVEPVLVYDNLNETMLIAGGQYEIKDVGIVN
jgi:hypothetical protein